MNVKVHPFLLYQLITLSVLHENCLQFVNFNVNQELAFVFHSSMRNAFCRSPCALLGNSSLLMRVDFFHGGVFRDLHPFTTILVNRITLKYPLLRNQVFVAKSFLINEFAFYSEVFKFKDLMLGTVFL